MKNKKIALAAVSLFSVFALAACSNSDKKDLVVMKGDSITQEDFYKEIKASQTSQQALSDTIVNKVAMNSFGKKVDEKEVTKQFNEIKEQYGDEKFKEALKASDMTEDDLKGRIKNGLATEAMIKSHIKVTDDDLKAAWKTFHPEVEAQIIKSATLEDATALVKEITAGGDFTKIAKEKSLDEATKEEGGKIKFDSTTTAIPGEVQTAAFALKDNTVSEVITATVSNGYGQEEAFYIVKMVKNKDKGNDLKPFKADLTKIVENSKLNDATFRNEVIGKELQKAKVEVKDNDLKGVLSQFIPETTQSTDNSGANKDKK